MKGRRSSTTKGWSISTLVLQASEVRSNAQPGLVSLVPALSLVGGYLQRGVPKLKPAKTGTKVTALPILGSKPSGRC